MAWWKKNPVREARKAGAKACERGEHDLIGVGERWAAWVICQRSCGYRHENPDYNPPTQKEREDMRKARDKSIAEGVKACNAAGRHVVDRKAMRCNRCEENFDTGWY